MSRPKRILFTSPHCYFDPASGAALATRDLFDALSERGWQCGVFCGSVQDFERPVPFADLLTQHGLTAEKRAGGLADTRVSVHHFWQRQVRVTTFHLPKGWSECVPGRPSGEAYLALLDSALDRFQPDERTRPSRCRANERGET